MIDVSKTIVAKSDQLNADDLIGGPITIKVTDVKSSNTPEQPIHIYYDGCNGKPYKPCLTMRRVLVHYWGKDGQAYVGRSMTIYNEPTVRWAGKEIGGIRISHMSDMITDRHIAVTVVRGKKEPYTVKPLTVKKEKPVEPKAYDTAMTKGEFFANQGMDSYKAWFTTVDQTQFTAEQKKLFTEMHSKWKVIAANADNNDDEAPL